MGFRLSRQKWYSAFRFPKSWAVLPSHHPRAFKFKGVLFVLGTSYSLEGKVAAAFHPGCLSSAIGGASSTCHRSQPQPHRCAHDGQIDQAIGAMYTPTGSALAFLTAPVACGGANIPLFDALGESVARPLITRRDHAAATSRVQMDLSHLRK